MNNNSELQQQRKYAEQQIDRFVRRFDTSYKKLAYYAALPLVLTPDLLSYLRNHFLRDEKVPWVAEVDLLLSDICRLVGYEQYVMATNVRAYLLDEMEQVLGKKRIEAVARLLINYIKSLSQTNPYIRPQELETQQWAAMVFIDDQRQTAVRQISEAYQECAAATKAGENHLLASRSEMARLSRITQELAPQLKDYPGLLDFADTVTCVLADPNQVSQESLNLSYKVLEDIELRLPDDLLPLKTNINLQPFDFQVALIEINDSVPSDVKGYLKFIDGLISSKTGKHFTDIQTQLVVGVFANQTYAQIAASAGYSVAYLQNVAANLWKSLSEASGEKVTKQNLTSLIDKLVSSQRLTIYHSPQQAWNFIEDLGNGVQLEMVQIPQGSFLMGSPEDELERMEREGPQHQVAVPAFLMGKYAVTQAQWKTVANLPQVNRELQLDPSYFKGANRPVECVSWYDAVEFCARLSQKTGKIYRLPSEAEWEYACRARTTTPFHFGETITTDLANYDGTDDKDGNWSGSYGKGPKGVYRQETTPVGSFGVANAFGLYDMHGNVWEWCADPWHDSYQGAPTDGTVWDENCNDNRYQNYVDLLVNTESDNRTRLLRGGSWLSNPRYCRSAYRNYLAPDFVSFSVGFRVVCVAAWA
jgi:formylglycine-generating enzyme required for sulfatase activity